MRTVMGALTVTLCDFTLMARVMMGWEEPLSRSPKNPRDHFRQLLTAVRAHVKYMTEGQADAQADGEGLSVLNVGYGLGIVSSSRLPMTGRVDGRSTVSFTQRLTGCPSPDTTPS